MAATGQADAQMLDDATLNAVKRALPRIEDDDLAAKLDEAIYYDHQSLGVAYQAGLGNLANLEPIGFANANFNLSLDFPESQLPNGAGGNANTSTHFPWGQTPGGTHRCENVDSVTAFWLPKRDDGTPWPVVWYRHGIPQVFNPGTMVLGWNWTFPVDTVFFEILFMRSPDGEVYCFEIRTRSRDIDAWIPDVLRPFPTASHLSDAIKARRPSWRSEADLAQLVKQLDHPDTVVVRRLRDENTTEKAFDVVAGEDTLPAIDDYVLIGELLDRTPFVSAIGEIWKDGDPLPANAPTTEADFHIVPKNYDATFLGRDIESCARCHSGAQTSSRRWDINVGWYGYVRGNRVSEAKGGGILSWHPVEPGEITNTASQPVMNQRWVAAGVIAEFDPEQHPQSLYLQLTE